MNKRILRKTIFAFLIFVGVLNILSIFVWKIVYLNPKIEDVSYLESIVQEQFQNKEYESYEKIIIELDSIPNISYSLESEEEIISESEKNQNNSKVIFSELVKVKDKNYLLNIYSNSILDISELAVHLLKIHAFMTVLITIIICVVIQGMILNPIERIICDIRDYKFGKKPRKNKIKNEIDVIQNEFVSLTDALDEEKKEQDRIIASVSHDIKTPLTSVIGYSDLILNKNMSKEQMEKYNEKINSKSKDIKEILNNFDEYLVNNTSQSLKIQKIKIRDLLERLKLDYQLDLKASNIDFIIESNCNEEFINIDIRKIKRVFSNIIDNSVRYMKAGGVIKIIVNSNDDYFNFIIADNGKGVDEKIINKIFDPLFTTDKSRKISGLGLSICKEFIIMHGGNITAYNNLGLTIEFTIPKEIKKISE